MAKVKKTPPIPDEEKKHLPVLKNDEKVKEVHLSGTAITEAGKLTKHKFFDFLQMDIDDYSDLSFTKEEAEKIRGQLGKMSTGASSMVPMTCSPKCPFRDKCVFYQMGKAPYGRACLIEVNLIREWTTAYYHQYDIDPNNFTEISMVSELAEIEVYLWRLNQILSRAENAELVTDTVVGYTPPQTGSQPIQEKKTSSYLETKLNLSNRKTKLIKLMVGDRQEKYKREAALKQRDEDSDTSSSMADLKRKLTNLAADIKKKDLELRENAGEIIDAEATESTEKLLTPEDIIGSEDEVV